MRAQGASWRFLMGLRVCSPAQTPFSRQTVNIHWLINMIVLINLDWFDSITAQLLWSLKCNRYQATKWATEKERAQEIVFLSESVGCNKNAVSNGAPQVITLYQIQNIATWSNLQCLIQSASHIRPHYTAWHRLRWFVLQPANFPDSRGRKRVRSKST